MSSRYTFAVVAAAAFVLSACGKAEAPKAAAPPAEQGIFVSTTDCADSGKLSAELCGAAIDMAVAAHEQTAPTYKSMRLCAAAAGADRCDKSVDGQYRPRLQAFLVVMGEKPTASGLYPAGEGVIGFNSSAKKLIDVKDESFTVSTAALAIAHDNSKIASK